MKGTFEERFFAKVQTAQSGCWIWRAARLPTGYGQVFFRGKRMNAHRAAYLYFVGPISEGLQLHHECGQASCVNPSHLVPVTAREHIRITGHARCDSCGRFRKPGHVCMPLATHCRRGHEMTPSNAHVLRTGYRRCRRCHRENVTRYRIAGLDHKADKQMQKRMRYGAA